MATKLKVKAHKMKNLHKANKVDMPKKIKSKKIKNA
jgi:hypothetical protein